MLNGVIVDPMAAVYLPPPVTDVATPTAPVAVGTTVHVTATVGPALGGPFSWRLLVDGVAIDTGELTARGVLEASFTPTEPQLGVVTVEVTDQGETTAVEAAGYLVVYDPSAGFVTGGGWIESPPGALVADPDVKGKATFGFVAAYRAGRTTPTGTTEFQFNAGRLNFRSTTYDWLVVSGPDKATFRGLGTINGTGNYKFTLAAFDGSPDRLQLRIANPASDTSSTTTSSAAATSPSHPKTPNSAAATSASSDGRQSGGRREPSVDLNDHRIDHRLQRVRLVEHSLVGEQRALVEPCSGCGPEDRGDGRML